MDKDNPFKLINLLENQNSITKFVINLNEDSSSDEENEEKQSNQPTIHQPNATSNKLDSPTNSSTNQDVERSDKNIANKIQKSKTKSLVDKNVNSLSIRLQETDQHTNRLRKLINKKNLNVQQMKSKIVQNQLKLRKQQAQVKKLHNLYLTASKEMKDNMKEISTLNNSLSELQRGVDTDKKLVAALEFKSKNLEKMIEMSLKELDDENLDKINNNLDTNFDNMNSDNNKTLITDQQKESTTDQDPDNMSLASFDEQQMNLILEHNDTSINRQDSLFVQPNIELNQIWQEEPTVNNSTKSTSTNSISQNTLPSSNLNNTSNLINIPIFEINSQKSSIDDRNISRIIDFKLDYTRRTLKRTPVKSSTASSVKKIIAKNQSPIMKKRPLNKKKNALLQKMLMIEERNEREEIERAKKEELNKKKLLTEQKEKDISEMRQKLKNKQILSNAIIGLKKDIRNILKSNDKIENYDLFVNGLTLFLENSLDKSYLLDDLTIKIDNKLFDNLKNNDQSRKIVCLNSDYSIYSNNLLKSNSQINQQNDQSDESSYQIKEMSLNQDGSVLESIRAYRLSYNFEERYIKKNGQDFTLLVDSFFANKINPNLTTCNFDLNGKCNDDNCNAQHKEDFILDQRQKIIDLLLYNPSITRYRGKVETKEDMNGLLKHLNEFVDNLEKKYSYNEMIKYLVKLIRISDDDNIIVKTKVQMQQTENTSINEYISNQSQQIKDENTFPDFTYNFKIRDRKNVLTYSKLLNSTKPENQLTPEDYENNYEKRFFNVDGVEKNLEEYCEENPTDVKCWIKLAFLQINSVKCKHQCKKHQLQNAVKIIVKGLNFNRTNIEMWRTYLYLLVNLLNHKKTDENFEKIEKQLQFICKKIIEQYASYEMWKMYLSLSLNYLNKELISSEILDEIQSNNIFYYDPNNNRSPELISHAYLEMILYKINLYIEINKHEKAKTYLSNILSSSIQPISVTDANEFIKNLFNTDKYSIEDRKKYQETAILTNEDKVFLWLNYLHLVNYDKLPTEKFELFKQSFSSLVDKKPFLITFNAVKKIGLEKLLGILVESIKDCFFNIDSSFMDYHKQARKQIKHQMQQQSLITCLPLFHNLANLYYSVNKKKTALQVFSHITTESNQVLIPLLINKALFEEKNNYDNEAFYTLGDTQVYKQDNFDIIYYLCMLHFKNGEFKYFNYEASKILNSFFDFDRSIPISISFKKLLYRKIELDVEKQRLLERVDSKLWTLYLMSEILATSEDNIDSLLYNSISLSKLNKNTKTHTINLLHFLYLNFYAKTITDQERLNEFLNKLQYACLFIENDQFQFYLLKHFSNCFFSTQQRFKFFLKFLILLPQNKYILNHLLSIGFNELNSKKMIYNVLKYFIDRKNLRNILEPVHWYLVIYLAIDFKEHLNLHYYFQLAISNYPYNKQLWHYLLAYEVSQNHTEHVNEIRSVLKQMKIPDLEKQLNFD